MPICTKIKAHDDDGWTEIMLFVAGIHDDSVVVDKKLGKKQWTC